MKTTKEQGLRFLDSYTIPAMGTDPELFLSRSGQLIGSERVIPEDGLRIINERPDTSRMPIEGKYPVRQVIHPFPCVVRDGVQAEFVIASDGYSCREEMATALRACFGLLDSLEGVSIDWRTVVDVPREELMALSESSRILGCAPSFNIYGPRDVGVPGDHPVRSAGGHLHLGFSHPACSAIHADPTTLVALLDVVLGNTCVLLDRDPRAAERREVYGRAGEHRLPSHGLEYRTLSNFWLRSYVLHSMIWAAVRFCTTAWNYDRGQELLSQVHLPTVAETINTNDAVRARETLGIVHTYMQEVHQRNSDFTTHFLPTNLAQWDVFTSLGIDYFWPTSRGWKENWDGLGWETFKANVINGLRKAA